MAIGLFPKWILSQFRRGSMYHERIDLSIGVARGCAIFWAKPRRRLSPLSCSIAHDPKISPRDTIASTSDRASLLARHGGGQGPTIPLRSYEYTSRAILSSLPAPHEQYCFPHSDLRESLGDRAFLTVILQLIEPCLEIMRNLFSNTNRKLIIETFIFINSFVIIKRYSNDIKFEWKLAFDL